jgi:hypothetical protein
MAVEVKLNQRGGPVTWSFSVSNLNLGVYRALLYNAANKVLERWEDQRTDDNMPDLFTITTPANELKGTTLWWQCIVSDPNDKGGPYTCTISVEQDSVRIGNDRTSGTIPPGEGKLDTVGDQITFK